jgi:hypothetical protein
MLVMLSRRRLLVTSTIAAAACLSARSIRAQQPQPSTGDANLRDTLLFGLKPRTPAEQAFIDTVVAKVNAKVLPLDVVISTFQWARPRRPFPFPYFERAMKARAAKIGVAL